MSLSVRLPILNVWISYCPPPPPPPSQFRENDCAAQVILFTPRLSFLPFTSLRLSASLYQLLFASRQIIFELTEHGTFRSFHFRRENYNHFLRAAKFFSFPDLESRLLNYCYGKCGRHRRCFSSRGTRFRAWHLQFLIDHRTCAWSGKQHSRLL